MLKLRLTAGDKELKWENVDLLSSVIKIWHAIFEMRLVISFK